MAGGLRQVGSRALLLRSDQESCGHPFLDGLHHQCARMAQSVRTGVRRIIRNTSEPGIPIRARAKKALSRHPPDAGFADRGFVFTEKAPLVEDCCTWAILAVFCSASLRWRRKPPGKDKDGTNRAIANKHRNEAATNVRSAHLAGWRLSGRRTCPI
jgi:hypothetical protein